MSCNPLIEDTFEFPKRAFNAPAQARIASRIGRYPDFRESMLRSLDSAPELAAWTHRQADDPGIALVEGAAILGDILTFYQEHYANEVYLRTAAWRESVAELVRLTGYRLAPGLGGRATFAFEARGTEPVTISAGFAVKAELEGGSAPADFQTDAELEAWPHLGRLNLYAPREYAPAISAGTSQLELASVAGATDSASLAALEFKPRDRLMLVPDESVWSSGGGSFQPQAASQMVTIAKVTRTLDRVVLDLEKPLVGTWTGTVRAWRIGRTFRHFGHNAPPQFVRTKLEGSGGDITGATAEDTRFERAVTTGASVPTANNAPPPSASSSSSAASDWGRELVGSANPNTFGPNQSRAEVLLINLSNIVWYSVLAAVEMPLDQEASDFAVGGTLIVEGRATFDGQPNAVPFVVTRNAVQARASVLQWANQGGPSTILTLDGTLLQNEAITDANFDIRDIRLYETTSDALTLRPVPSASSGEFASGAEALGFYGTATQAQLFAGRRLYLSHADGRSVELTCTSAASDFPIPTPDVAQVWTLSFDRPPTPLRIEDFSEETPTVTVFGNLVDASQGRLARETALGNGDQRRSFQTFVLPKSPLTYLLASGSASAIEPELEIRVNGRQWIRVESFYGHGPEETIYIVREDAEGRSFVQFGDGETGARLPSGVKNVVAIYRTGSGARGVLKPGTSPTTSERPRGFDKVSLAGIVSGGADPEDIEGARTAAPGGVQSLGRLVSITDYESEARAIAGVVAAAASWDLHVGLPVVLVCVLLEAGREAEFAAVQSALRAAQRCSGPDRFPIVVEPASMRYLWLDLNYERDPSYAPELVAEGVRAVLDELFGLRARRLGEPEYASRIEGCVQNVPGVSWCRVAALGSFDPGVDPEAAVLPAAPRALTATLGCARNELLQLAEQHLTLTETVAPVTGVCAS